MCVCWGHSSKLNLPHLKIIRGAFGNVSQYNRMCQYHVSTTNKDRVSFIIHSLNSLLNKINKFKMHNFPLYCTRMLCSDWYCWSARTVPYRIVWRTTELANCIEFIWCLLLLYACEWWQLLHEHQLNEIWMEHTWTLYWQFISWLFILFFFHPSRMALSHVCCSLYWNLNRPPW